MKICGPAASPPSLRTPSPPSTSGRGSLLQTERTEYHTQQDIRAPPVRFAPQVPVEKVIERIQIKEIPGACCGRASKPVCVCVCVCFCVSARAGARGAGGDSNLRHGAGTPHRPNPGDSPRVGPLSPSESARWPGGRSRADSSAGLGGEGRRPGLPGSLADNLRDRLPEKPRKRPRSRAPEKPRKRPRSRGGAREAAEAPEKPRRRPRYRFETPP